MLTKKIQTCSSNIHKYPRKKKNFSNLYCKKKKRGGGGGKKIILNLKDLLHKKKKRREKKKIYIYILSKKNI